MMAMDVPNPEGGRAHQIESLLRAHRFRFVVERELQQGIDQVLGAADLPVRREVSLGQAGVIDFLIGDLGLEVKTSGSLAAVTRQLHRYAQHPAIAELLLVTSRMQLARLPATMNGKPIHVVHLLESAL